MNGDKGMNIRSMVSIAVLLLTIGTFVGGYHVMQYRVASAETDLEKTNAKIDDSITVIKKDIGTVKVDVGKLQTSITSIEKAQDEIKDTLNELMRELLITNRGD